MGAVIDVRIGCVRRFVRGYVERAWRVSVRPYSLTQSVGLMTFPLADWYLTGVGALSEEVKFLDVSFICHSPLILIDLFEC